MRSADHHVARLHRRQGDRRDPVRTDHGRRDRRQADAAGAERPRRRALHQDRQGPRGRSRRRAADEADTRTSTRCSPAPRALGVFGTKERSVINAANREGIAAIVAQQFEVGRAGAAAGPGADHRARSEHQERRARAGRRRSCSTRCCKALDALPGGKQVMLKLSHARRSRACSSRWSIIRKVLRVVALSGGFTRAEACAELAQNPGMIASFSPACGSPRPDERRAVRRGARQCDRACLGTATMPPPSRSMPVPGRDRMSATDGRCRLSAMARARRWNARVLFGVQHSVMAPRQGSGRRGRPRVPKALRNAASTSSRRVAGADPARTTW